MKYLNLKQIVQQTYENELEKDNSAERFKKLYDHANERLLEILNAMNFYVELIKEDGEYHIPQEDGEFIQWILEHYTDADMKLIRKGEFVKANLEYVFMIISGLDNMMKHLEIEDGIRNAQLEYMHTKTDYHIQVRLWNTQVALYRMFNDVVQYMKQPVFNLTYDNRIDYLDEVGKLTEEYIKAVRQEFSNIWKKREQEIIEKSYPITIEEIMFSERSEQIRMELSNNEEFVAIQKELREMRHKKGFLNKYEKQRTKKEKRLVEIFREIASRYPVDVDKMTKIERIMCLADSGFQIHFDGNTKQGYITFDVDVSCWDAVDPVIWE